MGEVGEPSGLIARVIRLVPWGPQLRPAARKSKTLSATAGWRHLSVLRPSESRKEWACSQSKEGLEHLTARPKGHIALVQRIDTISGGSNKARGQGGIEQRSGHGWANALKSYPYNGSIGEPKDRVGLWSHSRPLDSIIHRRYCIELDGKKTSCWRYAKQGHA
jgi:hypothetical protein